MFTFCCNHHVMDYLNDVIFLINIHADIFSHQIFTFSQKEIRKLAKVILNAFLFSNVTFSKKMSPLWYKLWIIYLTTIMLWLWERTSGAGSWGTEEMDGGKVEVISKHHIHESESCVEILRFSEKIKPWRRSCPSPSSKPPERRKEGKKAGTERRKCRNKWRKQKESWSHWPKLGSEKRKLLGKMIWILMRKAWSRSC